MANLRKQYSKIYDQYINKIYRFVFLKVSSKEVAEDLTTEVFVRGWDKYRAGEEFENIQAFLYQVARNLVIDHYRVKGRDRTISTEYTVLTDPRQGIDEKAIIDSDFDQVRVALANINEDYQEVVVLRYLDELSISEIAKILNKSEGTTRVMIHRAMESLRKEMDIRLA